MADENTQAGQGQRQPVQTARKMSRRRSTVYEHFTCFKDAQGNDKARCKYCGLELGANTKNGTSNLRTHVCKARDGESSHPTSSSLPLPLPQPQQVQLQQSGPGESCMEQDEASRDLARMIALHGYDPSVVEDNYFKSFVRRLNPGYEVPSRKAIEEMCFNIFEESRSDMYDSNEDDPGKLSLAVGEAKTIETGQVVYVTTHFIDNHWNLHRVVDRVNMVLPVGDYFHVPLWRVPMVSLDDAVDHIMSDILSPDAPPFVKYELFMVAGEMTTGHINLIELKDRIEQNLGNKVYSATYMDHVLKSIARCLLPDSNFAEIIFDLIDQYLPGDKRQLLTQLGLVDDPWEYDDRWYSCYCSLEILHQVQLDSFFFFWKVDNCTEQLLLTLWREIYRGIKRVSDSSRPTSNLCLQELFKVRDAVQSQLSKAHDEKDSDNYDDFGNKSVADVLGEALETVHVAIQASYLVLSLPLILDPRYKLRYIKFIFERAFGSEAEKYISEVRTETEDLYKSYIKADDEDSAGITEEMAVDSTNPLERAWDEQCRSQGKTWKVDSHAEAKVELDCYLEDRLAPRTEDFDILDWWKQNSAKYPTVARMARDALAMPTCSKLTSDQMAHVRSIIRGYCYKWW